MTMTIAVQERNVGGEAESPFYNLRRGEPPSTFNK